MKLTRRQEMEALGLCPTRRGALGTIAYYAGMVLAATIGVAVFWAAMTFLVLAFGE